MKTNRKWIVATFLTILLISLATPLIALPTSAHGNDDDNDVKIVPERSIWYKLESDIATVLFPAGGKKPMFIWRYTKAPDQIYIVKYEGLIEYFVFDSLGSKPEYYKHLHEAEKEAWRERFEEMYFKPEENRWKSKGDTAKLLLLGQYNASNNGRDGK